jgi:hypothetical protein
MNKIRSFGSLIKNHGVLVALGVVITGLFLYRLGSLAGPGLAPAETAALQASGSYHDIIANPLYLPLTAPRWLFTTLLPGHFNIAARLPSVLLALISIAALIYIVRHWYKQRTMFFGLVLIASSAWILHVGRLATNDIAYLAAVPILIAIHLLLYDYTEKRVVIFIAAVVFAAMLYIPGLVWLALASLIWQRSEIKDALKNLSWPLIALLAGLIILMLAPLLYGFLHNAHSSYALMWLGLPGSVPTWKEVVKNVAATISFVFVRTPADSARWLGQLPLFDAFMIISFIAGVAFYLKHISAERTKLLLLYGTLGLLLCAVGGSVTRSILVPTVYLVAIGGIAFILHQWLQVFPRNPLARRLGVGMICIAIALSCTYNLRHYFVAWPHNRETAQEFSLK